MNDILFYIEDEEGNPVPCENLLDWARWFTDNEDRRIVSYDTISNVDISTVFLGVNHNLYREVPMIYETMIFQKEGDNRVLDRYPTREAALRGHCTILEAMKKIQNNKNETTNEG